MSKIKVGDLVRVIPRDRVADPMQTPIYTDYMDDLFAGKEWAVKKITRGLVVEDGWKFRPDWLIKVGQPEFTRTKVTSPDQLKHGMRVECVIQGDVIDDAMISISSRGFVYICQNHKNGSECTDRLGYKYSWVIAKFGDFIPEYPYQVKDLFIIEPIQSTKQDAKSVKKGGDMAEVTAVAKQLLSSDTQVLMEQGYIDSQLNPTGKGRDAIDALVFADKKADLVKMAQAEKKEEAKTAKSK